MLDGPNPQDHLADDTLHGNHTHRGSAAVVRGVSLVAQNKKAVFGYGNREINITGFQGFGIGIGFIDQLSVDKNLARLIDVDDIVFHAHNALQQHVIIVVKRNNIAVVDLLGAAVTHDNVIILDRGLHTGPNDLQHRQPYICYNDNGCRRHRSQCDNIADITVTALFLLQPQQFFLDFVDAWSVRVLRAFRFRTFLCVFLVRFFDLFQRDSMPPDDSSTV